jgi:hypothetical protein
MRACEVTLFQLGMLIWLGVCATVLLQVAAWMRLRRLQAALTHRGRVLMGTMADLDAKVEELRVAVAEDVAVDTSAVTLLERLTQLIADAIANQPSPDAAIAAVQAVLESVNSSTQALAAAVTANTPAA